MFAAFDEVKAYQEINRMGQTELSCKGDKRSLIPKTQTFIPDQTI